MAAPRRVRSLVFALLAYIVLSVVVTIAQMPAALLRDVFLPSLITGLATSLTYFVVVKKCASHKELKSAIYALIWSGVSLLAACQLALLAELWPALWATGIPLPVAAYLYAATSLQWMSFARPKLRPLLFRMLISWPAGFYFSASLFGLLQMPLLPLLPAVASRVFYFTPFVLALLGLYQTVGEERWVTVNLSAADGSAPDKLQRLRPRKQGTENSLDDELRIVQFTDPHLGPFISVHGLRRMCEEAVQRKPHLVLLTGDFYTKNGDHDPHALSKALQPLSALPAGRVFACLGNHDKESGRVRKLVVQELEAAGVKLLVDEEAVVDTPVGKVQMIGLDWRPSFRVEEHIQLQCDRMPPRPGMKRIVMLHDPAGFRYMPDQGSYVFCGHTHGGMLGLLTLGIQWTVLSALGMPDQGLFGQRSNRMYIHRGQGSRFLLGNFLVRCGVPPEQSLLLVRHDAADKLDAPSESKEDEQQEEEGAL